MLNKREIMPDTRNLIISGTNELMDLRVKSLPLLYYISIVTDYILNTYLFTTVKCSSHPLSKKLPFAAHGNYHRQPSPVKIQRTTDSWLPNHRDTSTIQLLHLRLRAHWRRGAGDILKAFVPGSLMWVRLCLLEMSRKLHSQYFNNMTA